jgi:uncharacterized protein (UPF0548 family)
MFFAGRPTRETIDRFLRDSEDLPLSYGPAGIVRGGTAREGLDEALTVIGHGRAHLDRARAALAAWKQFDLGWVELFPRHAPVDVGTVVAVLIRHAGFWSLNGCRVLYHIADRPDRFGVAYGTLTNHAESGEELFEVFIDPRTGDVKYRIRATSWGQATLARIGQPIVRLYQARFRRDSATVMKRAVQATSRPGVPDEAGRRE